MSRLLLLGAGGYGRTVADIARQLGGYEEIAFLDDGRTGPDILGGCEDYRRFPGWACYPAFGSNEVRSLWRKRLVEAGFLVPTFVHPAAYVSPTAELGSGTVVLPGAMVGTKVSLGAGCIVNMGAIIDHDCTLGDDCHLAPGAVVKAENHLPPMTKVDSGEVIPNRAFL